MDKILIIIKRYIPEKLFRFLQPVYHYILSWLAALCYRFPSEKLVVIGVTGTTGKTTSVCLIAKTLESVGYKVGYTSTAMFNDGEKEWLNDKKMTMAGRFFTQKILRNMLRNKCQYAIIETTSEGIRQFRHKFINYDILVFTGLYPEHIDSHGSFKNYKEVKGRLFAHLKGCQTKYINEERFVEKHITGMKKLDLNRIKKTIIVNKDDEHADYFLNFWSEIKIAYSNKDTAINNIKDVEVVNCTDIEISGDHTSFKVNNKKISLQLLGDFNAMNAMNAVTVCLAQEISLEKIKVGLESIKGIPGRFERIDESQNFIVVVDYAFEPRAVTKLYEIVALIPHSKIIHVIGSAGGGRDIARRPKLGEIAGKKADYIIITNEDPYNEDPNEIINQVARGVEKTGKKVNKNLFKILDRREAIKKALRLANKNDIVLITGKGNEQAICIANGEKIKWDDREVVRNELKKLKMV